MPRKKPSPDDEPLFGDANTSSKKHKRKKKDGADASASQPCAATNCELPAAPDSLYCNVHALMFDGMRKLRESSRRAAARGDFGKGLLHGLASTGIDLLGQLFTNAGNRVANVADQAAAGAGPVDWTGLFDRRGGPLNGQPPQQRSCWEILGLDPETATADDIRDVQRKLAAIYHTDKANPAITRDKIAEINSAAQQALKDKQ